MDWIAKLNRTLAYIEEHLRDEIDIRALGAIAGCTPDHFQRLFSYIAGCPLAEYIRNRRLTLAAFELLHTDRRILDIAILYGYESQDAFARAFRRLHGVLPSAVRQEPVRLMAHPRLSLQLTVKGGETMRYQLETWPAFTVTGYRHRLPTESAFDQVPRLWQEAWQGGEMQKLFALWREADARPTGVLGLCIGGGWGEQSEMDYLMGVTTHVQTSGSDPIPEPQGMTSYDLPAATWAVFDAGGPLPGAMQDVLRRFYSEWLPASGYRLDDLPAIECYQQEERQELWVAVLPREEEARE